MAMLGFLAATAAAALGLLAVLRLARGHSALPKLSLAGALARTKTRQVGVAAVVGAAALLVTRWPLAGLAAGAIVFLWPRLFGGGAAGRRQLEKIEALAAWTESLRDTATAAAGLEQAIPATVGAAHALLRAPVRELAARLDGRVPLPEALARFADDVDDPAADMVVAALSLNARQRAGGLERILTSLAASSRTELEMRRKVEHERRALRRQAQRIALAVVGFVALQALFARGWVEPYSTPLGQLVLAILTAIFLGAFVRMRSLSNSEAESRFLTSPDDVTEIASYKPHLARIGATLVIAFMIAAGLVAVAVLHAYRLAVPPRADLASAVRRWDSSRARATRIQRIGAPRRPPSAGRSRTGWSSRCSEAHGRQGPHPGPRRHRRHDRAVRRQDNRVGLVGFFGPLVILGFLNTIGLGLPLVFGPAAGVALAGAMLVVTRQELTDRAKKRRAEFRRTLSVYLDLVAMSMQAGRGHAEALPASAAIGTGWAFTHLQDAIDGARFSGTTPWHALGQLGDRFGIRELTDLDAALTLGQRGRRQGAHHPRRPRRDPSLGADRRRRSGRRSGHRVDAVRPHRHGLRLPHLRALPLGRPALRRLTSPPPAGEQHGGNQDPGDLVAGPPVRARARRARVHGCRVAADRARRHHDRWHRRRRDQGVRHRPDQQARRALSSGPCIGHAGPATSEEHCPSSSSSSSARSCSSSC